ncbi:MAG TPA: SDR family oxidoreductase [Gemmatimonadaceae bacterium]|nr:SDR family oxidoreductase [Gemmatimonadaceae bacterium]
MIDLNGKTVVVTGGSRGIGAYIVRTLAGAGAHVVLHYSNSAPAAEEIVAELGMDRVVAVRAPLEAPGAGARLWSAALAWRGRVDVLVNNAGVAIESSVDDSIEAWRAAWDTTWQVNVVALADLCREAILHFRGLGGGTIINVSSRAAFRGDSPHYMHYAASKGAVVALTKSIARGYAREGVLAYGVAPGWVATDMARQSIQMVGLEKLVQDIPMGAMAPPEDVANVVAFLASGLAPHATGTTIDINGASYVR